ncbi:hypothetical protein GIB67_009250 [Kingdonia uniflora]|uniref:Nuclear/nucleolar GTPase 2 n=1 Tax=Kingdonia uniflora TaxID=39325 RepID=A0A7J7N2E7_9MAGN|nr:hypothetical protein GIB67_009250 [Kingdonia uniflora]
MGLRKKVNVSGKPKHSLDTNRNKNDQGKGKNNRSARTIRRLAVYNLKPKRTRSGRVVKEDLQSKELPNTRIHGAREFFGNTRVVGQDALTIFRKELQKIQSNTNTVILRERKLPMSLLNDYQKQARVHLLDIESFEDAFGPKGKRKRPRLTVADYESLVNKADGFQDAFEEKSAAILSVEANELDGIRDLTKHTMFMKGQSKRIWRELYKVRLFRCCFAGVGCRDPLGTRCYKLERLLKEQYKHKNMVLLLNKCDLVPKSVISKWLHVLSKEYPTVILHACLDDSEGIHHSYGMGSLLSVLRQFSRLKTDKPAISVGLVGYPNVGKSTVINTLRKKKNSDTETDIVLKGVVRVTNLEDATEHIGEVLKRVEKKYLQIAYNIKEWDDATDFLVQLCKISGKLLKGGEPDLATVAKMVLHDWQRGRLIFFVSPPTLPLEESNVSEDVTVVDNGLAELQQQHLIEEFESQLIEETEV